MSVEACCFTGHRVLPGGERYLEVRRLTEAAIRDAYAAGCRRFFAGGAIGFDMLAAAIVCALRDSEYPDMTLHLLLPCRDQAERWSSRDRERYHAMLAAADTYAYLTNEYHAGVMSLRNRALIDAADLCIAYMQNPASGTGGTLSMARKRGIAIRNIADEIKM